MTFPLPRLSDFSYTLSTLEWGINMPAHLLIFKLFSRQHALILHSVFIHSNIFDQKYQKFMFFRLQYAHFWALILVSIKFSRRHVYHFHKLFQQACLFWQACLFRTLEYLTRITHFEAQKPYQKVSALSIDFKT